MAKLTATSRAQRQQAVLTGEPAEWLNSLAATMWQLHSKDLAGELEERLNDVLATYTMPGMVLSVVNHRIMTRCTEIYLGADS